MSVQTEGGNAERQSILDLKARMDGSTLAKEPKAKEIVEVESVVEIPAQVVVVPRPMKKAVRLTSWLKKAPSPLTINASSQSGMSTVKVGVERDTSFPVQSTSKGVKRTAVVVSDKGKGNVINDSCKKGDKWYCPWEGCKSTPFKFRSKLIIHYDTVHLDVRNFKCPDCNQLFKEAIQLKRHRDSVHLKNKVKCEYCGQEFNSLSSKLNHIRESCQFSVKNRENTHECPVCFFIFTRLRNTLLQENALHV